MTKEAVIAVVEKIAEEAVELLPIAAKALEGLLAGKAPEQVLSQAERATIAKLSQDRFDAALARGKGSPAPGTGT